MAVETADRSPQTAALDLPAALKDAGIAALVSLVLAVPMFGFHVIGLGDGQGLGLEQRWDWVAIAVAAVFAGRLALNLVLQHRREIATATSGVKLPISAMHIKHDRTTANMAFCSEADACSRFAFL